MFGYFSCLSNVHLVKISDLICCPGLRLVVSCMLVCIRTQILYEFQFFISFLYEFKFSFFTIISVSVQFQYLNSFKF